MAKNNTIWKGTMNLKTSPKPIVVLHTHLKRGNRKAPQESGIKLKSSFNGFPMQKKNTSDAQRKTVNKWKRKEADQ